MLGLRLLTLPPETFLALLIGHCEKAKSRSKTGTDSPPELKLMLGAEGRELQVLDSELAEC